MCSTIAKSRGLRERGLLAVVFMRLLDRIVTPSPRLGVEWFERSVEVLTKQREKNVGVVG